MKYYTQEIFEDNTIDLFVVIYTIMLKNFDSAKKSYTSSKTRIIDNKISSYDSKPGENLVPYAHLKIFSSNQVTLLPCCSLAALLKNLSALHDDDDTHIGNNSALTVRKIPSCSILNYKSNLGSLVCLRKKFLSPGPPRVPLPCWMGNGFWTYSKKHTTKQISVISFSKNLTNY